jgi:hypothetical protein
MMTDRRSRRSLASKGQEVVVCGDFCPAGERLTYRYTREEGGLAIGRYWTGICSDGPMKALCTQSKQRRVFTHPRSFADILALWLQVEFYSQIAAVRSIVQKAARVPIP